jgi:hypothetical protein
MRGVQESAAAVFVGSMVNAAMVIGSITFLTLLFVVIYMRNARHVIIRLLQVLIALLAALPYGYFGYQLCWVYDLPIDILTLLIAWLNWSAVAAVALVYLPAIDPEVHSRAALHKASLLALSLALAWPFLEFPEWSVWCTFISLGVYGTLHPPLYRLFCHSSLIVFSLVFLCLTVLLVCRFDSGARAVRSAEVHHQPRGRVQARPSARPHV